MALTTPNIIVYSAGKNSSLGIGDSSIVTEHKFNGETAMTSGSTEDAYFYICNKATAAADGTPRDLVNPIINLMAVTEGDSSVAAASTVPHANIKLYCASVTSSGKASLSSVSTHNSKEVSIRSWSTVAAEKNILKGIASSVTATESSYSKIRITAQPQPSAPAGSYSYQLSIKGTYT